MTSQNVIVILGHPDPHSLNHAIAGVVCRTLQANGHHVVFHDLHAERFDPRLPAEEIPEDGVVSDSVRRHCRELQEADGIVIVHGNWWGQPPAVLKGWVDRVVRPGVAYRFEEGDAGDGIPVGLLKAQAALVLNTSNTPDAREQAAFGDPLESLWKRCIFNLCGVRNFHRRTFNVVVTSTFEQRRDWLGETALLVNALFARTAHLPSL